MENYNRDLLVLFKTEVYNEDLLQYQVDCLHKLLLRVECNETFCVAHELVTRNKITNKVKFLLRAISESKLKPFNFLLNKN